MSAAMMAISAPPKASAHTIKSEKSPMTGMLGAKARPRQQPQACGGIFSNAGRPSGGRSQLGARPAYTEAIGLKCSASSSVPALTIITPGRAPCEKRPVPHTGQKVRVTILPLSPGLEYARTSPVTFTAAIGTAIEAEWLDEIFLQSRQ
jgi:hypothetical protein